MGNVDIKKLKPYQWCDYCKFAGFDKNKKSFCDKEFGDLARYGPTETRYCGYFKIKENNDKNGN